MKAAGLWAGLTWGVVAVSAVHADPARPAPGNREPRLEGRLDPKKLLGEHQVTGRNPNGSAYRGKVIIRLKKGLLLFQWTIAGTQTHGTGLLEDMTVGVALGNGVALYQAFPQTDGISLIGLWKTADAPQASEETIFVGNADMTDAQIPAPDVNGKYDFRRGRPDDPPLEGRLTISGGDIVKKFSWQFADGDMDGEGLALGDGLAVITPEGLAVYASTGESGGKLRFSGESVDGDAERFAETLSRTD